jgi:hypothetical protein
MANSSDCNKDLDLAVFLSQNTNVPINLLEINVNSNYFQEERQIFGEKRSRCVCDNKNGYNNDIIYNLSLIKSPYNLENELPIISNFWIKNRGKYPEFEDYLNNYIVCNDKSNVQNLENLKVIIMKFIHDNK